MNLIRIHDNEEHEAYITEHGDIPPDEDYEMDLKVSDRKMLWASSGNKCAICKCKLVRKEQSSTNVGEECHISSENSDWPSKEFSRYELDLDEDKRNRNIDNAILLCSNCHKIIDNPKSTQFTIEALHQIKEKHEADVGKDPEVINERKERRKQLQEWIDHHNLTLMNNFITPWSESKSVDEPNLFAIEHLQIGYPDIWKLRPDKSLLRRILKNKEAIKEVLNKEFGGLPESFEYKHTSDIEKIRIYKLLEDFFQKDELPEESTIKDSEEFVEAINNHKVLNKKIKLLNRNETIRDKKSIEFEKGLKGIVFGINDRHKELKGTCKSCIEWHDELESLK